MLETVAAISWIVLPVLGDFMDDLPARNFFMCAGAALILVVSISDYRSRAARQGERRRGKRERRLRGVHVAAERRMSLSPRRERVIHRHG